MIEVILELNQCLQDIPVQVYGNAQALWILLEDNPELGADLEKPFVPAGTKIKVRENLYQNPYAVPANVITYQARRHKPANGEPCVDGISIMAIGVDFIVGSPCGYKAPAPVGGIGAMTIGGGAGTIPFIVT